MQPQQIELIADHPFFPVVRRPHSGSVGYPEPGCYTCGESRESHQKRAKESSYCIGWNNNDGAPVYPVQEFEYAS